MTTLPVTLSQTTRGMCVRQREPQHPSPGSVVINYLFCCSHCTLRAVCPCADMQDPPCHMDMSHSPPWSPKTLPAGMAVCSCVPPSAIPSASFTLSTAVLTSHPGERGKRLVWLAVGAS